MDAEKILQSLVNDKKIVKEHKPWGFYIETPFEAIKMIGFIDKVNHYELSLFYGDTQRQSQAFYNFKPQINNFEFTDWLVRPNFHLQNSFGENIIWFGSKLNNQDYIDFWVNNKQIFHKHNKSEIDELIDFLENKGVIYFDESKRKELKSILSKDYSGFNICAGFSLIYSITKEKTNEFENINVLDQILIDKINEGLRLIGKDGFEFLKYIANEEEEEESGDPDGF